MRSCSAEASGPAAGIHPTAGEKARRLRPCRVRHLLEAALRRVDAAGNHRCSRQPGERYAAPVLAPHACLCWSPCRDNLIWQLRLGVVGERPRRKCPLPTTPSYSPFVVRLNPTPAGVRWGRVCSYVAPKSILLVEPWFPSSNNSAKVKTQRLTIFLLRAITEYGQAIAPGKSPTAVALDAESGIDGIFYFVSRPPSRPAWVT